MTRTIADFKDTWAKKQKEGSSKGLTGATIGVPEMPRVISTQDPMVDWVLGGGIPVGHITEISGDPGTGKTSLAVLAAANAQKEGFHVLFLDFERSFVKDYFEKLGLSLDEEYLTVLRPLSTEQGKDFLRDWFEAGLDKPLFIIVDSIPAMVPESEAIKGEQKVGGAAKANAAFARLVVPNIFQTNSAMVLVNHLRVKIGGMSSWGGVKKVTAGGDVLKYNTYIQLRLSIRQNFRSEVDGMDGPEKVRLAACIKATTTKNKMSRPSKVGYFGILFGLRLWPEYVLTEFGVNMSNILNKAGSWFKLEEDPEGRWEAESWQGQAKAMKGLIDHPAIPVIYEELVNYQEDRISDITGVGSKGSSYDNVLLDEDDYVDEILDE